MRRTKRNHHDLPAPKHAFREDELLPDRFNLRAIADTLEFKKRKSKVDTKLKLYRNLVDQHRGGKTIPAYRYVRTLFYIGSLIQESYTTLMSEGQPECSEELYKYLKVPGNLNRRMQRIPKIEAADKLRSDWEQYLRDSWTELDTHVLTIIGSLHLYDIPTFEEIKTIRQESPSKTSDKGQTS